MTYDITSARVSAPPVTVPTLRTSGAAVPDKADHPDAVPAGGQPLPPDAKQLAAHGAKLENVVKQLNDYAQTIQREVRFSIDKASGMTVVKVIDSKTKDLIRQIPSEEILALDRRLAQGDGLVFSAKA
jgi:flagellar protein FlaG